MNEIQSPQPFGACALLLNKHGQVLAGKRKNAYGVGLYGFPGGRIEVNEPVAQTIRREIEEETGLLIEDAELIGVVRENQGSYDFIHFIYVAKDVVGEPQLLEPEKCEGWEWRDMASIEDSLLPGHLAGMKLFQTGEKFADLTN